MEFNFFAKSSKKRSSNPFLNRPKKEVAHSRISDEARKEEDVIRHNYPKNLPKLLRVTHARFNPYAGTGAWPWEVPASIGLAGG